MYVLITLITGTLLFIISKLLPKSPDVIDGKSLLKLHPFFGALSYLSLGLGLVMPFYLFIIGDFTKSGITIMMGLFILFFGIGYWMFLLYRNHKVLFDDKEIIITEYNKKEKKLLWSDIKAIRLNTWTSKYILTLNSGEHVGVNQYLKGVEDFIKRVN